MLVRAFSPVHNFQAIHNFFSGTGKSSSFFFFTDNKEYVLKTLKDSERKLLFDNDVLKKYAEHILTHNESLLSRFYGVFTFKTQFMGEMTCFITDNLIGKDFLQVNRLYDLKGSTFDRKANLTVDEVDKGTGMRVLKDVNF